MWFILYECSSEVDEESGDEIQAEPDSEEEFSDGANNAPPPAKKKGATKKSAKGRGRPKSKASRNRFLLTVVNEFSHFV